MGDGKEVEGAEEAMRPIKASSRSSSSSSSSSSSG